LRINRGLRNGHIRQGTTSAVTAVVRNLAGRAMKKVDITLLKSPPYQGLAAVSGLTIEAGRAFSLVSQQAVNFNVVGSVEVSCLVRVTVERYNEQQHRLEHVYNVPKIASLLIFVDPVPSVPQDTSKI
jgi:hypothetical protein